MLSVQQLSENIQIYDSQSGQRRSTDGYIDHSSIRTLEQVNYENNLLNQDRSCKSDMYEAFPFLEGLQLDILGEKLKDEVYNGDVLEAIRCALNIIIDNKETNNISIREKIHELISNPVRFGTSSVNGYALKTGLESAANHTFNNHLKKKVDLFVLKCPRNPYKSLEMVHEMVVCLEGLNKLRSLTPPVLHFSQGFDSFKDGVPIVGNNKQTSAWSLPGTSQVSYALYESVYNPMPIGEVKSAEDCLLYITQGILGLKAANEVCDFTHFDAHHENGLLMDYSDDPFYIEYNLNGKTYFLKSNGKILMFIDYGMSHIKTSEGVDIGIIDPNGGFNSMGISSTESNYMSDPYKLICMIMFVTEVPEVKEMCRKMLGYFYGKPEISVKEMNHITSHQWDTRFHIPKELVNPAWNMTDLIIHCFRLAKSLNRKNVTTKRPSNVIGCGEVCRSRRETLKQISSVSIPIPSPFDLYENKDLPIFNDLLRSFSTNPQASKELEEAHLSKFFTHVYNNRLSSIIDDPKIIKKHKNMYYESVVKIAKIIEDVYELNNHIKYIQLCNQYQPTIFNELLVKTIRLRNDLHLKLNHVKTMIATGREILMKIVYIEIKDIYESREIERAQKSELYPLCDIYMQAYGALNALE
jgi:hypothetical protein